LLLHRQSHLEKDSDNLLQGNVSQLKELSLG